MTFHWLNKKYLITAALFVAAVLITAAIIIQNTIRKNEAYQNEIEDWHTRRINRLERAQGWLSLVALDWLNEEKNVVPSVGVITLKKEGVFVEIKKAVSATLNGRSFSAGILTSEEDTIMIGSRAFTVIKRSDQYAVRMWDSESPVRKSFSGIDRYPVDSRWRIEARWEPYSTPKKVDVPTVIPGVFDQDSVPGAAVFSIDGKKFRLEPTIEDSDPEYFFVFGDATNGKETYGGGRFLYTAQPKDGKIILDFNKAYNPPCAFTEFATCPLPLPENRLGIAVNAGEEKYRKN
jgi:uncharacterized protein (DUF1684 family)